MKYISVPFLIFLLSFSGCSNDNGSAPVDLTSFNRGEIISHNTLESYSPEIISQGPALFGMSVPVDLNYSVEAVHLVYATLDPNGNMVQASGAVFIPSHTGTIPMISIHNGTETKRALVASVSPFNSSTGIAGILTASTGFLSCVPDYLGFGVSGLMHPYIHAESSTITVIDFLRA